MRVLVFLIFLVHCCVGIVLGSDLTKAERYSLLGLCRLAVDRADVSDNSVKLLAVYCLVSNGKIQEAYSVLDTIDDPEIKVIGESLFRKVDVTFKVSGPTISEEEKLLGEFKKAFYLEDYDTFFSLAEKIGDSATKRRLLALANYRIGRFREFLKMTEFEEDPVLLYYRIKVKRLFGLDFSKEERKLLTSRDDFYSLIYSWDYKFKCKGHDKKLNVKETVNLTTVEACKAVKVFEEAGIDEKTREFFLECLESNPNFIYRVKNPYWGIRSLYLLRRNIDLDRYTHLRIENKFVRLHSFRFKVDEDLVYAVMRQESLFNRFARSKSDARGLMQMIPSTGVYVAEKLGESKTDRKLFIPYFSIRYGTWYLGELSKRFNLPQVIVAYNKGPTRLAKWLETNRWANDAVDLAEFFPIEEARVYLRRVILNYYNYRCNF